MNKNIATILVSMGCILMLFGCAGKNKNEIQKRLMHMSDRELIHHYEMIDMRMIDIDRNREQSIEQWQDINQGFYLEDYHNHWGHLHVGDNWNTLNQEKKLTEIEMRRRSLSPLDKK